MNKMNKVAIGLLVIALVLGAYSAIKPSIVVNKIDGGDKLGAVSPYNPTPNINLGGLNISGLEKSLATATSTVCAIQAPAATSTLVNAGVKFTLASTSAVTVDLAKGTTQYATTTMLGTSYGIAASAQATIVASSTLGQAGGANIFAPNTWFVVRINQFSNSSGAANASTGRCWATFAAPQ